MYYTKNYQKLDKVREILSVIAMIVIFLAIVWNIGVIISSIIQNKSILSYTNAMYGNIATILLYGVLLIADVFFTYKMRKFFYKRGA